MRSKAKTLTVSTDTEGPTHPPWIPEAPEEAHPIRWWRPLGSGGLASWEYWMRPRLHLPVNPLLGGAPGKVGFREERILVKSLRGKGEPEGLPDALHLTGSLAFPGAVGLQPHLISCWKGRAR